MAILNILERMEGHNLSQTPDNTTYTRVFRVTTDILTFDFAEVLGSPQIPIVGESHPSNTAAKVTSIEIEHADSDQLIYDVVVTYDTNKEDNESFGGGFSFTQGRSPDNFIDPTLEDPRIAFTFQDYQEVDKATYSRYITRDPSNWDNYELGDPDAEIEFQVAGDFGSSEAKIALKNGLNQRVATGLQVIRSYPVINITQNVREIDLMQLARYHNTVNANFELIAGYLVYANEGLIKVNATAEFDSRGDQYWKVTQIIRIDHKRRHHEIIMHTGPEERFLNEVTDEWEVEALYSGDGKTKKKDGLLDVNGQSILNPEGEQVLDEAYILFKKYPSTDWGKISPELPTTDGDVVNNAVVGPEENLNAGEGA